MKSAAPRVCRAILLFPLVALGCREPSSPREPRWSGHVEATEVRVASEVGGRVLELSVNEGDRVKAGDPIARLDTRDTELTMLRARAERDQADAQLRLLRAGSRPQDIRQAEAETASARADLDSARAELSAAQTDLSRFEELLERNSGSRKQRDDAATRQQVAEGRVRNAEERVRAATEAAARVKAGPRPQEIDAARARLAVVDAEIAALKKAIDDATVTAPSAGVVTEKLVEPGEVIAARTALVLLTDLDHAWANVYVEEPLVPRLTLNQAARIYTDAGDEPLPGTITYISPRAEFTPRNVQTAEERSKLVYRVKITVDNSRGILKPGMPVEAELATSPPPRSAAPGAGPSAP
jgi:HlyD family secretion protein